MTPDERSFEELQDAMTGLVDEFFPKGQCAERGKAIVFNAKAILLYEGALTTERNKRQEEQRWKP